MLLHKNNTNKDSPYSMKGWNFKLVFKLLLNDFI